MLQAVEGGPYRCALVVKLEAEVDEALLAAIAEATGLRFEEYGYGGFGGETSATVYTSGDNLLMDVLCDEAGVKAMFVWADSAEHATGVRDAIGAAMPAWSEQMLRGQLEGTYEDTPEALVALLMACGGANPGQETLDLLQRALDHDDEEVQAAAEYARLVASELRHPPVVMREQPERELEEILRPAEPIQPAAGESRHVTVRAGIPDRAVPRPVTWLSTPYDDPDDLLFWMMRAGWVAEVMDIRPDSEWHEQIYCPRDRRTALHLVQHPAVGNVHIALHGNAVDATAAALVTDLGAEILAGPPEDWERTAAG
ncbi:hypothetical protein [Flindersiella endophytica]